MGLGMSMSLAQTQAMKLDHATRMTQSINLAATLMDEMWGGKDGLNGQSWHEISQAIVAQMNEDIRDSVRKVLTEFGPTIEKQCVQEIAELTQSPFPEVLTQQVAVKVIEYRILQPNNYQVAISNPDQPNQSTILQAAGRFFSRAFFDTGKLQIEIQQTQELLQSNATPGLITECTEMQDTLKVACLFYESVVCSAQLLKIASAVQLPNQPHSPIISFCRDIQLQKELSFLLADRTIRRFSTRFCDISKKASQQECALPLLNILSEYLLASMGILRAEIFTVKRGELDEDEFQKMKDTLQRDFGVDLETLAERAGIKTGPYFFSRWAVHGTTSKLTDRYIQHFTTDRFRHHQDAILEAAAFPQLYEEIMSVKNNSKDRNEAKERLATCIADHLSEKAIQEALRTCVQDTLYPELVRLQKSLAMAHG